MEKYLFWILVCFFKLTLVAQKQTDQCEEEISKSLALIYSINNTPQDIKKGNAILEKLSSNGCAKAKYELGKLFYISSYGSNLTNEESLKAIFKFYKKTANAYKYLNEAANQGHIKSLTLLGHLYRKGYGCNRNYKKALNLYHLSHSMGDEEATFLIGYIHYKGLGHISQNYKKAIKWFKKKPYVMSNHFLGICNYYGFGMSQNQEKAFEIFKSNEQLPNSQILLNNLVNNYKNENELFIESEIIDALHSSNKKNLKKYKTSLNGKWKGKLIELDYSGKQIIRTTPVNLTVDNSPNAKISNFTLSLNDTKVSSNFVANNNKISFENFDISLPVLFKDYEKVNYHNFRFSKAHYSNYIVNNANYMVLQLIGQNNFFDEKIAPKLLVLHPANQSDELENSKMDVTISSNNINTDDILDLFPNPFTTQLKIAYELEEKTTITLEIYSLDGVYHNTLIEGELQDIGLKSVVIDTRYLVTGAYVVRITTDHQTYNEIIIKE